MKTSIGQLINSSLDTRQEEIISIKIQKSILKIACLIALLCVLAYAKLKLAIAVACLAAITRGIVLIKEILDFDLNFKLDKNDLAEIDEQLWS